VGRRGRAFLRSLKGTLRKGMRTNVESIIPAHIGDQIYAEFRWFIVTDAPARVMALTMIRDRVPLSVDSRAPAKMNPVLSDFQTT
jgi:hypothetical protein